MRVITGKNGYSGPSDWEIMFRVCCFYSEVIKKIGLWFRNVISQSSSAIDNKEYW